MEKRFDNDIREFYCAGTCSTSKDSLKPTAATCNDLLLATCDSQGRLLISTIRDCSNLAPEDESRLQSIRTAATPHSTNVEYRQLKVSAMWRSVRPDTMLLPIWWSSFSEPRQPLTASLHLRSSPLELMSRLAEQQPAAADSVDTVRSKRSNLRCEIQRVGLGFFLSRLQGSERLERQTWTQLGLKEGFTMEVNTCVLSCRTHPPCAGQRTSTGAQQTVERLRHRPARRVVCAGQHRWPKFGAVVTAPSRCNRIFFGPK